MKLSTVDKLVGTYILYGLWSGIVISDLPLDGYVFIKWLVVVMVYLLTRTIPHKNIFLYPIILAGIYQSIIAIGQQIGYIESNHSMFNITGFMGNPGQMGGFQATAFVLAISMLINTKIPQKLKWALFGAVTLIGYSVIIADSRAGWVAAIIGLSILFGREILTFFKRYKIALLPVVVAVVIGALFLFNYRSGSANSRLLIWRVCGDMIADKPIIGHGVGSFNDHYMLYQADYFKSNPDSRFAPVADNVAYPYNEVLHIWVEQGIIGVLIFVVLMFVVFRSVNTTIRATLAALLAFSMFSYPSSVNALLILFPILLGLSSKERLVNHSNKWLYIIALPIILLVGYVTFKEVQFHKIARTHIGKLLQQNNIESLQFFSNNFDRLIQYPQLNNLSAIILAQNPDIADKYKLSQIIPISENWCDIGSIYQSQNDYDKAEYPLSYSHILRDISF